jgi:hypothetical protein
MLVRYADDSHPGDSRMLHQDVLHFQRVDVLSATHHHVVAPSRQSQVALGVQRAEVSGVQPTVLVVDRQLRGRGQHLAGASGVRAVDSQRQSRRRPTDGVQKLGATRRGTAMIG